MIMKIYLKLMKFLRILREKLLNSNVTNKDIQRIIKLYF